MYLRSRTIATPAAYAVGGLSVAYAIAFLGFVRPSGGANTLPSGLGAFGIVAGGDLVLLYLATLVGADTLILVFGGLAAVILGPAFWMWTGSALRR